MSWRNYIIGIWGAAFLVGILVGLHGFGSVPLALAAGWFVAAGLLWRRRPRAAIVFITIAILMLGLWRGSAVSRQQQSLAMLIGQSVTVAGEVADDPQVKTNATSFTLQNVVVAGYRYDQTISVYTYGLRLQRGYRVVLAGRLRPGFGSAAAELFYPKALTINQNQSWLERWRQRFFAGVDTALPDPIAPFVLGLLVGVRALIPKPLQLQLARTGLSHLVAVSGYNLTIIAQACRRLTGRLGYNTSFILTLWLIGGFVVLTGAPASIVRAAVVAVLVLWAGRSGRRIRPLNLLVLAAAVTVAWRPAYLFDLGWQLSFAAFFGITVMAPLVEKRLGLNDGLATPGALPETSTRADTWRQTLLKLLVESTCPS